MSPCVAKLPHFGVWIVDVAEWIPVSASQKEGEKGMGRSEEGKKNKLYTDFYHSSFHPAGFPPPADDVTRRTHGPVRRRD